MHPLVKIFDGGWSFREGPSVDQHTLHDVAVIGAGPAGMMAAIQAGQQGASVILLEKNDSPGRKLLLTGGLRCNLSHWVQDSGEFIEALGKKGRFLHGGLKAFGVQESLHFFECLPLALAVEADGRVFPASGRSVDVLHGLVRTLQSLTVELRTGIAVGGVFMQDNGIGVLATSVGTIRARAVVLATGGCAYPETGSTGDGYGWTEKMGHSIVRPCPGLTALALRDSWVRELAGVTLPFVAIKASQDGRELGLHAGGLLFTHEGLSGPVILNFSRVMGRHPSIGSVDLTIDLLPDQSQEEVQAHLQSLLDAHPNKSMNHLLGTLVPLRMTPIILSMSGIPEDRRAHSFTREERRRTSETLKGLPIQPDRFLGFDQAMITLGGIELSEIDPRTMGSLCCPNLFFAGEILDLDGPTGGYNLQICWTTGAVAGRSAAMAALRE